MTQREFFTEIANLEGIPSELKTFALEGIEKLNHKNSLKSGKLTETQKANLELAEKIFEILTCEPMLSTDVALALGVSTQKANGVLGNLFKEGKVDKVDIKVKGKGTQKGWLIPEDSLPLEDVAYPSVAL